MSTHDPFSVFLNEVLHGSPNQDLIDAGLPALRRLYAIALEDGGSSYVAATFCLVSMIRNVSRSRSQICACWTKNASTMFCVSCKWIREPARITSLTTLPAA